MGLISLYFYSICLCGTNKNYGRGKFPGVNTPMVLSLVLGEKSVGRDLKYRDNLLIIVATSKHSLTMTNTSLTIQMKTAYSTFSYLCHSVKELVNLLAQSYLSIMFKLGLRNKKEIN